LIPKPKTGAGALAELLVIVALALGLALGIQAFLVKPYQIPSESMEPTLDVGQRVLVNRAGYHIGDPKIGDIVVFHPPQGADQGNQCGTAIKGRQPIEAGTPCPRPTLRQGEVNFIKRIVAGPGDQLSVEDGHPVVNGHKASESFITPCQGGSECNLPHSIRIPPDHYFMMGDNRGQSDDSRFWGPVPRKWIVGKAFLTYWPPKRVGFL
jgi:signal peptidase I